MGLLHRANKRKCYPVDGLDGVFVRSMTSGEIGRMNLLEKELKTPFVMGCCLVTSEGKPETTKRIDPPESDVDFSKRVLEELEEADVDTETLALVSKSIGKIGKVPIEDTAKNLPTTAKPDSQEG